jgi:hypothetical protein
VAWKQADRRAGERKEGERESLKTWTSQGKFDAKRKCQVEVCGDFLAWSRDLATWYGEGQMMGQSKYEYITTCRKKSQVRRIYNHVRVQM